MISLIVLLVLNQHSNHEEPIISCPNFAHGNGNFKSYGNASKNRKMAWIWHWIWWASQFHTLFWWVVRNLLSRSEKNSTAIWFSNRMYLDIFFIFFVLHGFCWRNMNLMSTLASHFALVRSCERNSFPIGKSWRIQLPYNVHSGILAEWLGIL